MLRRDYKRIYCYNNAGDSDHHFPSKHAHLYSPIASSNPGASGKAAVYRPGLVWHVQGMGRRRSRTQRRHVRRLPCMHFWFILGLILRRMGGCSGLLEFDRIGAMLWICIRHGGVHVLVEGQHSGLLLSGNAVHSTRSHTSAANTRDRMLEFSVRLQRGVILHCGSN